MLDKQYIGIFYKSLDIYFQYVNCKYAKKKRKEITSTLLELIWAAVHKTKMLTKGLK